MNVSATQSAPSEEIEMSDVQKSKLLGCPFCGRPPVVQRTVEEYDEDKDGPAGEYDLGFTIACNDCGISMLEEYRADVVARWNHRAKAVRS